MPREDQYVVAYGITYLENKGIALAYNVVKRLNRLSTIIIQQSIPTLKL